jgi:hypothetical protein
MLRTETCAPSQPLFIHGDGTVSRMMPYPDLFTADGLPCNTNTLMDITDWAKTPLGDRENWSPSLRTLSESHNDVRLLTLQCNS